jgi:hypothetical protein
MKDASNVPPGGQTSDNNNECQREQGIDRNCSIPALIVVGNVEKRRQCAGHSDEIQTHSSQAGWEIGRSQIVDCRSRVYHRFDSDPEVPKMGLWAMYDKCTANLQGHI